MKGYGGPRTMHDPLKVIPYAGVDKANLLDPMALGYRGRARKNNVVDLRAYRGAANFSVSITYDYRKAA